jgi:hypothetical protein
MYPFSQEFPPFVHSGTDAAWEPPVRIPSESHGRAVKILAKSIYKELRQNGYIRNEIVAFSSELLGLVTTEIKSSDESQTATAS